MINAESQPRWHAVKIQLDLRAKRVQRLQSFVLQKVLSCTLTRTVAAGNLLPHCHVMLNSMPAHRMPFWEDFSVQPGPRSAE